MIPELAKHCAQEAIMQAGALCDDAGQYMLPMVPLDFDYEYLAEGLGRKPSSEEVREFENVYREIIRDYAERHGGRECEDCSRPMYLVK